MKATKVGQMTNGSAKEGIEKAVAEGLQLGLKRQIASLFEVACSPAEAGAMDRFERGVRLAVDRCAEAITRCEIVMGNIVEDDGLEDQTW